MLANGFRERIVRGKENDNVLQKLGNAEVDEEEEEEKDLPDGIEEEIESLMDSLSDKVRLHRVADNKRLNRMVADLRKTILLLSSGYYRPIFSCKVPFPNLHPPSSIIIFPDCVSYYRKIREWFR